MNLVLAVPLLVVIALAPLPVARALAAAQAVFGTAYMAVRLLTLSHPVRTGRWARVGAS